MGADASRDGKTLLSWNCTIWLRSWIDSLNGELNLYVIDSICFVPAAA
jgi:hypothetical protein